MHQSVDCQPLLERRRACYTKHSLPNDGLLQEKSSSKSLQAKQCLVATLAAKRCLAFQHCEIQALHYYGTPNDSIGPKALCASFEEGYCFGNPGIMKVDSDARATTEKEKIFAHHQNAKRRIVNNRNKFRACQDISDRIHQCLRNANLESSTSMA